MSIEIDHAADEYTRHLFDVLNGVQELREVRESAFTEAQHWARELTRLLKGQEGVPKRHLYAIYAAMGTLENEAPGSPHEQRIMEIADAIRLTFSMILTDRCHEDYNPPQPGIPRMRYAAK
jgi:hypothetical protein